MLPAKCICVGADLLLGGSTLMRETLDSTDVRVDRVSHECWQPEFLTTMHITRVAQR
jgi:hypothetical protein